MRIFATGANGYIGQALVKKGVEPLCFDVRNPHEIEREIKEKQPDIIIHLASKSDPDWCELQSNRTEVADVNVRGTLNVFKIAAKDNIPCVLLSSGQVWRGGFWEMKPHREEDKRTPPVNIYGISKIGAEISVGFLQEDGAKAKIVRSSYVFDSERLKSKFDIWREGRTLSEPTFIRRSFIYLYDFVEALLDYCEHFDRMPDVLHLAGSETVSWFDFTYELAKQFCFDTRLVKSRRMEIESAAPRPHNAGLNVNLARSFGFRLPGYVEGINRMKNEG